MILRHVAAALMMLTAGPGAAQSGCVEVSAELDRTYRGFGTAEGAQIADRLAALDVDFILQLYTDTAREAAKSLESGRPIDATEIATLDNLTGMIDCFIGDQDRTVFINGFAMPFSERFFNETRLALLDALDARDSQAPVLGCVRGGQC